MPRTISPEWSCEYLMTSTTPTYKEGERKACWEEEEEEDGGGMKADISLLVVFAGLTSDLTSSPDMSVDTGDADCTVIKILTLNLSYLTS